MSSKIAINHLAPIEALPDDVLFHILQQSPQLRSASRKLHALSELLESHCLVRDYALFNEQRLLDRVQSSKAISQFLHKYSFSVLGEKSVTKKDLTEKKNSKTSCSSARVLRTFLSKDYCFFSKEHLVQKTLARSDQNGQHQQESLATANKAKESTQIPASSSLLISHEDYGLSVNGIPNSFTVRYKTRLAPGRYEMFVHMTASNAFGLLPMRFSVPENPFVRQNFPPFPPGKIAVGAHDRLSVGTEIYLGDITVTNSMAYADYSEESSTNITEKQQHPNQSHWGTWPIVEFEITEVGKFSDIQLNYLSFETKPISQYSSSGLITPPRNHWEIVNREFEPSASLLPVTPELIDAYNELNRIKLH